LVWGELLNWGGYKENQFFLEELAPSLRKGKGIILGQKAKVPGIFPGRVKKISLFKKRRKIYFGPIYFWGGRKGGEPFFFGFKEGVFLNYWGFGKKTFSNWGVSKKGLRVRNWGFFWGPLG